MYDVQCPHGTEKVPSWCTLQQIAASLQLVSNLFPILDNETLSYDIMRSCADYHVCALMHKWAESRYSSDSYKVQCNGDSYKWLSC